MSTEDMWEKDTINYIVHMYSNEASNRDSFILSLSLERLLRDDSVGMLKDIICALGSIESVYKKEFCRDLFFLCRKKGCLDIYCLCFSKMVANDLVYYDSVAYILNRDAKEKKDGSVLKKLLLYFPYNVVEKYGLLKTCMEVCV